ncbi:hypothetical protein [Streptomyces sp. NPDC048445]
MPSCDARGDEVDAGKEPGYEIIGLLAEPTMCIEVHPCSALPADPA